MVQLSGQEIAYQCPAPCGSIHQVIVYCNEHRDKRIILAIDAVLRAEKARNTK